MKKILIITAILTLTFIVGHARAASESANATSEFVMNDREQYVPVIDIETANERLQMKGDEALPAGSEVPEDSEIMYDSEAKDAKAGTAKRNRVETGTAYHQIKLSKPEGEGVPSAPELAVADQSQESEFDAEVEVEKETAYKAESDSGSGGIPEYTVEQSDARTLVYKNLITGEMVTVIGLEHNRIRVSVEREGITVREQIYERKGEKVVTIFDEKSGIMTEIRFVSKREWVQTVYDLDRKPASVEHVEIQEDGSVHTFNEATGEVSVISSHSEEKILTEITQQIIEALRMQTLPLDWKEDEKEKSDAPMDRTLPVLPAVKPAEEKPSAQVAQKERDEFLGGRSPVMKSPFEEDQEKVKEPAATQPEDTMIALRYSHPEEIRKAAAKSPGMRRMMLAFEKRYLKASKEDRRERVYRAFEKMIQKIAARKAVKAQDVEDWEKAEEDLVKV